jgi:chromosome segregation ATPase
VESKIDRGLRQVVRTIHTTMTTATITLDRELVHRSFRDWQADQAVLDAQLNDSVVALEAYQSHLDHWQRELARERDDLQRLREELDRNQTALDRNQAADGNGQQRAEQLEHELYDARTKITSLTTALLDRTEELRQLDRQRADINTELALAKTRERDLSTALEALQKSADVQCLQWESAIAEMRQQLEESLELVPGEVPEEPAASDPPLGPIAASNPVLGSLMEQFDKLRQQRSVGRQSHTRTR